MTLREAISQAEREAIEKTLKQTLGRARLTRAAEALGIARKTLWTKMKMHGIDKRRAHPQGQLAL